MLKDGISRLLKRANERTFRLLVKLESLMTDYGRMRMRQEYYDVRDFVGQPVRKPQAVRVPVRTRNYRDL